MSLDGRSHTVGMLIDRPLADVYAFLQVPRNFSAWASGLGSGLSSVGGEWVAITEYGPVRVRFSEPNAFGVLDHHVFPASGETVYVPMRVVEHGPGTVVLLTLLRQPDWTDEQLARDIAWVESDLQTLKHLLERDGSRG